MLVRRDVRDVGLPERPLLAGPALPRRPDDALGPRPPRESAIFTSPDPIMGHERVAGCAKHPATLSSSVDQAHFAVSNRGKAETPA